MRLWISLSLFLALSSCAASPAPQQLLYCHTFDATELKGIRNAITALPDDSPLLPVLYDYKRVCANLKA